MSTPPLGQNRRTEAQSPRPHLLVQALTLAALLGAMVSAHAPWLADAWAGETYLGHPILRSDTLDTQKLGLDAWLMIEAAWAAGDPLTFFTRDLWQVAIQSRALNLLDLPLTVWPIRAWLPLSQGLVALHLGLLALAIAAGWVFAREVGAGLWGRAAAGVVTGAAGVVWMCTALGQYPQAMIFAPLLYFAGLERARRDERGAGWLIAGGLSISLLLYWQNALLLGAGTALYLAGAAAAGDPIGRLLRRAIPPAITGGALCLPAALPILEVLRDGQDTLLSAGAWGAPYPEVGSEAWRADRHAAYAIYDAIPLVQLLDPSRGWLVPALPLVPLMIAGARRAALPWAALLLPALVVLGPIPEVPSWMGGQVMPAAGDANRIQNPLYQALYQWLPTFSRMHHALRWDALVTAGGAALVALGAARLGPKIAGPLAIGGAIWAAAMGPWPLPANPLPGEVADELRFCEELIFTTAEARPPFGHKRQHLAGLAWRPAGPLAEERTMLFASPSEEARRRGDLHIRILTAMIFDRPTPGTLPAGACVVMDPIRPKQRRRLIERLDEAYGAAVSLEMTPGVLYKQEIPPLLIWRVD